MGKANLVQGTEGTELSMGGPQHRVTLKVYVWNFYLLSRPGTPCLSVLPVKSIERHMTWPSLRYVM